jgi:hypothetical protein
MLDKAAASHRASICRSAQSLKCSSASGTPFGKAWTAISAPWPASIAAVRKVLRFQPSKTMLGNAARRISSLSACSSMLASAVAFETG